MGTSAYDLINKQTPLQTKQGGSAYDMIQKRTKEVVDSEEDPLDQLGNKLGDLWEHLKASQRTTNPSGVTLPVLQRMGQNVMTSLGGEYEKVKQNFIDGLTKAPFHTLDQQEKQNNVGNVVGAFIHPINTVAQFGISMADQAEKAIDALTNTVNEDGVARPATVEEQAKSLQAVAGTAAQIALFKGLKAKLAIPGEEKALLALQRSSKAGKIARNMMAETVAAGASGAGQAFIENMGDPAQQEAAVAAALTYAPIGAAFGLLGGKSYIKELDRQVGEKLYFGKKSPITAHYDETILPSHPEAINQIAAINNIKATSNDTFEGIIKKIDIVNKSDEMVEAAVRENLGTNDAFIVPQLTDEQVSNLSSKIGRSETPKDPEYTPHPDLKDVVTRLKSKNDIHFEKPLDKVAYMALSKKPSARTAEIVQDALDQTGLTKQELINHGKNIKDSLKSGRQIARSQIEIDKANREAQANGESIISKSKEGDLITAGDGTSWVREGNVIKGNNGLVYPIESQEAHLIIGRDKNHNAQTSPIIALGAQKFNPFYGNEDIGKVHIYRGLGDATLFSKTELSPEGQKLFKFVGLIPGEIVSFNGKDVIVSGFAGRINRGVTIKDVTTGKEHFTLSNFLTRTDNSLFPKIPGDEGFKVGTLTPESFVNGIYSKFYDEFKDNRGESFNKFSNDFFTKRGIAQKDVPHFESYIYKKLGDDLAKEHLTPEEFATRNRLSSNMEIENENKNTKLRDDLDSLAKSNGMYFKVYGGGRYTLETFDNSLTIPIASPNEAFDAIRRIGRLKGYAFDGGGTNVVNPAIANISGKGYDQSFSPRERSKLEKRYDQSTATGILSVIAPVVRRFASVDNSTGISNFLEPALDIQNAQLAKKSTGLTPEFQNLTKLGNEAHNLGRRFSEPDRWKAADYLEAANAEEIANSSLARPLNSFEKKFAATILRDVNVQQLRKMMYEAKVQSKAEIGTPEYAAALQLASKRYSPELMKAASQLISASTKLGKDLFTAPIVLDYGEALNNPDKFISRELFRTKNGMSDELVKYAEKLDEYFKSAADVAGIDKRAVISKYLPRIQSNVLAGAGSAIPQEFARELERFGITGTEIAERDPNELIRIYHSALLNHKSGFSKALAKANTEFQTNVKLMKDQASIAASNAAELKLKGQYDAAKVEESKARYYTKVAEHMDDVTQTYLMDSRGIPNIADQSAKAANRFSSLLGLGNPETNSVLQLFSLGNIALRPALALRDVAQSLGNVYISFGQEFARRAFMGGLSDKYMEALQKKGAIPKLSAGQIMDPGSNGTGGLLGGDGFKGKLNAISESSFRLSGQELAYNRILAGMYKATHEIGERELKKLHDGIISKDEAYKTLGVTVHGKSVQLMFDKLLTEKGRPDEALDYLGKWHGRYVANIFGMANNPSGWNSNFGRLLGQYGAWSANASHTLMEQLVRGEKKDIITRILRAGVVMAAAGGASQATGFKLWNWAAGNPLSALPGTGPIVNNISDLTEQWNKTGDPSAIVDILGNDALGLVPYSRAVQDWKKSYDLLMNDDPRFIGQAIGMQAKR